MRTLRVAFEIDRLLAKVPPDDPAKAMFQARARAYSRECGCKLGGIFLAVSWVLGLAYFAARGELGLRTGIASFIFAVFASVLGKLTGLLLASVRLALLRRSLSKNLQQET
jgi:hypothetical protein